MHFHRQPPEWVRVEAAKAVPPSVDHFVGAQKKVRPRAEACDSAGPFSALRRSDRLTAARPLLPPREPTPEAPMEMHVVKELILQSLEHEMGGVKIYETALKCAQNEDLKEEWQKYHQETERHVQVLQDVCAQMQLDAQEQTPGRKIVHDMGAALVAAIEAALGSGDPAQAD